ncbi:hypothetical protein M404DRAFT_474240 [Pisolithus tinctorius Marx 270]|uniref:Uncharacterized protein n=1 Tax=Pisolithus tinctorius Marx 270 TaxID=870435 RepID=A0A0C3PJK3_PISTI|nr:hypothetical protein M404DRAFT_474240 [Pisolithus tinctorius Marx 270]
MPFAQVSVRGSEATVTARTVKTRSCGDAASATTIDPRNNHMGTTGTDLWFARCLAAAQSTFLPCIVRVHGKKKSSIPGVEPFRSLGAGDWRGIPSTFQAKELANSQITHDSGWSDAGTSEVPPCRVLKEKGCV